MLLHADQVLQFDYVRTGVYVCECVCADMPVQMPCSLPEALSPVRGNFDHMVHNMTHT